MNVILSSNNHNPRYFKIRVIYKDDPTVKFFGKFTDFTNIDGILEFSNEFYANNLRLSQDEIETVNIDFNLWD